MPRIYVSEHRAIDLPRGSTLAKGQPFAGSEIMNVQVRKDEDAPARAEIQLNLGGETETLSVPAEMMVMVESTFYRGGNLISVTDL